MKAIIIKTGELVKVKRFKSLNIIELYKSTGCLTLYKNDDLFIHRDTDEADVWEFMCDEALEIIGEERRKNA